ncbi:MAG: hypothetical protein QNM02_09330 [Acidimicrobiia bacterium]|nr:hypothetical protein [Acidimicrobiia bacterium]
MSSPGVAEGRTSLDALLVGRVVAQRIDRGPSDVLFLADESDPSTVTIVAKTQRNPPRPGSDAHTLYRLHETLALHAADGPGSAIAPRPVGWGSEPDLFAYEYSRGVPVKERIESLAPDGRSSGAAWPVELSALARASGALLAGFHAALTAGAPATISVGRLHQQVRRAVVGSEPPPSDPVRSLCDSGPHNLIAGADGSVGLIDLPTDERWTFAEFDIGVLALRLARRAAIAFHSTASAGDAHRVFTDPLCAAYAAAGRELDRAEVFASFATASFVFAKRSLTIGHPLASLDYARRDLSWGLSSLRTGRALASHR